MLYDKMRFGYDILEGNTVLFPRVQSFVQ